MMNTRLFGLLAIVVLSFLFSFQARAHCDTMNGPVVKDAKVALETGDLTPVLKWIQHDHEAEVRRHFEKTRAARGRGSDIKELVDTYFFETVVRLHRAGEGEPYTGLKQEGSPVEPGVEAADHAIETRSVEAVVEGITGEIAKRLRTRFQRVLETKREVDHSVDAGRAYVAAYVEFIHFVEGIHRVAQSRGIHDEDTHNSHQNAHQ